MWRTISTWAFSFQAVSTAAKILSEGGNAVEAAEAGIMLAESDVMIDSVGRAGFLNARGELELDAAIMDGNSMKMGAVASVKGFEHPISIARAVMERTSHSILVGAGAEEFARRFGMKEAAEEYLIPDFAKKRWEKEQKNNSLSGHDTIGMITMDHTGRMAAGTSSCGAFMKLPGRVGDAPVIGSGFYVETEVGGAVATGWGEDIMRSCCSFRTVELMRGGMHPQEAAEEVIKTAHDQILRCNSEPRCMAIVCMNAAGEFGGAANHCGFWYVYADENKPIPRFSEVTPVRRCDVG